ncbi:hypothetical protein [Mycolicibacterium celeriflavum]|uniref:Uncharacterized protein n=1 Tax=Mycolicibacterium celeriflavum TaxID=1249101 RepID=A0A1X0BJY8_MYCCF|nr:hypothetical protein [Mycolicibacterium celeriflavum]MCV7240954.1 hypothetical protein [Mycolicibacterium celeriflavum]ORA42796.1 hypothetical protein BST21_22965 [Mycolicibacterium celeriflavum]BBY44196.1 hypothetical protein MCEL_24910 [Mycolicibacterium celeriflavum]
MNCSHTVRRPVDRIDVGEPYPQQHDCTATVQQLVDVAVKSSLAFTAAALNCCTTQKTCAPVGDCGCGSAGSVNTARAAAKRTVRSEKFPTVRIEVQRQLTLATPLSNGYLFIPHDRITLLPSAGRDAQLRPLGILGPTEATFEIEVDATGLPGAVYFADVAVRHPDGKADTIVPVFIKL